MVYLPLHFEGLTPESPSDCTDLVSEVLSITLGLPYEWSLKLPKTCRVAGGSRCHLKAWYMSPGLLDGTSYFKSMDGHRRAVGLGRRPASCSTLDLNCHHRMPGMLGISASSGSIFMWPGWQQAWRTRHREVWMYHRQPMAALLFHF